MIDIHSHILPCVDDGSQSLAMTKTILGDYMAEGVDKVICTPHQNVELRRPDILKAEFEKLKEDVKDIPVELFLGAEIYYYDGMTEHLKSGELLTLNGGNHVLVEFSTRMETDIPEAVYSLSLAGYVPIVAHIERYAYLQDSAFADIKYNGGLIQVNSSSFAKKVYLKTLKRLLKGDMVDFIASDCHNDTTRRADFSAAKKYISKKFPAKYDKFFGDGNFPL